MKTPTRDESATPEQAPLLTVEAQPVAPRVPPRGASPTKVFRAWSPEQAALLPAAKRDHLGEGHLAVFLLDLLPTLTLQPILDAYADDRGQPPYDPRMMTVLLLYAYSQGITSSRQIERRCREDLGFMYLTADACPDHDTICAFRRAHLPAFQGLFLETLRIAQEAGVLTVGRIALDGTKIEANASKHKAMSYARMPGRHAALEAEIGRLLAEAEALDRAEDQRYGRGRRGDELPAALQDPVTRRLRLREAKARLEAERKRALAAQKQAQAAQIAEATQALEAEAREQARAAGQPKPDAARPAPKAQRNFTDPASRPHDLCPAEDYGGTRLRLDQGPRLSPLLAAGRGPGEGRVPLGVRRPQPRQTVADGERGRAALECRARGCLCVNRSAGMGSNRLGADPRSRNPPLVPSGRSARSFLRHAPSMSLTRAGSLDPRGGR